MAALLGAACPNHESRDGHETYLAFFSVSLLLVSHSLSLVHCNMVSLDALGVRRRETVNRYFEALGLMNDHHIPKFLSVLRPSYCAH